MFRPLNGLRISEPSNTSRHPGISLGFTPASFNIVKICRCSRDTILPALSTVSLRMPLSKQCIHYVVFLKRVTLL